MVDLCRGFERILCMRRLNIKETVLFGLLGALMYVSKIVLEVLPNGHLLGVFIVAITVVFRAKAFYPVYTFVFLTGLFNGFSAWWIPYLYIWAVLVFAVLALPNFKSKKVAAVVYAAVSSLHGFLFGTLYAPFQALFFGLDFKGMVAWIVAGIPFDIVHGVSNLICGTLILPLISVLKYAKEYIE